MLQKTIRENGLEPVVTAYICDVLKGVPKKEKWDLVVGNPPHFNGTFRDYYKNQRNRIFVDPSWRIHKAFYKKVSNHLSSDGSALFVENYKGSDPEIWKSMIGGKRLRLVEVFDQKRGVLSLIKNSWAILNSLILIKAKTSDAEPHKFAGLKKEVSYIKYLFPHYYVWSKRV